MFKEVPDGQRRILPPPSTSTRTRQSVEAEYRIDWDTCSAESCSGIVIPGQAECLMHASQPVFRNWLGACGPGKSLDLRGLQLTGAQFNQILSVYRDQDGWIKIEQLRLEGAIFSDSVSVSHILVHKSAEIVKARFRQELKIEHARFPEGLNATLAEFDGTLQMIDAQLGAGGEFIFCRASGTVLFARVSGGRIGLTGAEFSGKATMFIQLDVAQIWLDNTDFRSRVNFMEIQTNGQFFFHSTKFHEDFSMSEVRMSRANFLETVFEGSSRFTGIEAGEINIVRVTFPDLTSMGPLKVSGGAYFSQCTFVRRVEMTIVGSTADFTGCDFQQGTTIAGKYLEAGFEKAIFGAESTIMSEMEVSWISYGLSVEGRKVRFDERAFSAGRKDARLKVSSLRGVDVSPLLDRKSV